MSESPAPPAPPPSPRCKSARPGRRTSRVAFVGEEPDPGDPLLSFAPYLHTAPRRNSITPARQRAFIAALAATGIVTQAARQVGASLEALYKLRNRAGAEGFAHAWEAALDRGVARLEDCALALALEGEQRPIASGGAVIGWYRKHNVSLIQFLLRQRRPERYAPPLPEQALRPGHPLYERLRAEWAAEAFGDAAAVRAAIEAKLDEMRERSLAARACVHEQDE